MKLELLKLINEEISKHHILNDSKRKLIENLVSGNNNIYLVGKNEDSLQLYKKIKVTGLIDDYKKNEIEWKQIPLVTLDSISPKSIIVNCSTSISPISVCLSFKKRGYHNILNFCDLSIYSDYFEKSHFVREMISDFELNINKWNQIYENLFDQESKDIFISLILFRLTGNPKFMKGFSVNIKNQYLESFMNFNKDIYCDVGGYDGDTAEAFLNEYPTADKVLFFEPSKYNIEQAKKRLIKFNNIEYFPIGLSNSKDLLSFDEGKGSSSQIINDGQVFIQVEKFDDVWSEKTTYIKIDIEGWEHFAIEGMKNQIINFTPKLAIAVYHKSSDFWSIPQLIFSYNKKYELRLRHYTEGWSETIMFFIPKN